MSTTPSVPANNLKDFFDLVRKDPQKYTFGTTSVGSASHLAIELLKRDAGLDTLVVPYKGTAPALTDLMSGQIQLLADPMLSSLPLAQGGQDQGARADQPQARRLRRPRFRPSKSPAASRASSSCRGTASVGPKNLPADISSKLQADDRQGAGAARGEGAADRHGLRADRLAPPTEFAKYITDEMAKYGKIITDAKIKMRMSE